MYNEASFKLACLVTHIIKKKSAPYSKAQMFDLVANFERYPAFLPFCQRATLKHLADNIVEGTLYIDKGPFKKSFTTRNELIKPDKITIELVNGPFKNLQGEWRFDELNNQCQVTLDLSFDMKPGLFNKALSGVFEVIAKAMVDAFCKEADKLYQNSQ